MEYTIQFVMNQYSDGSGKPSHLASGASVKELPDLYIHFAHHDFDVVWNEETKRQESVSGVNKFFGGVGEGSAYKTWQEAIHVSLYDAYQVSDQLHEGDTFTAQYAGETARFRCVSFHVVKD